MTLLQWVANNPGGYTPPVAAQPGAPPAYRLRADDGAPDFVGATLRDVPAPTAIRRATVQVMRDQAGAAVAAHAAAGVDGRQQQTQRATNAARRTTPVSREENEDGAGAVAAKDDGMSH